MTFICIFIVIDKIGFTLAQCEIVKWRCKIKLCILRQKIQHCVWFQVKDYCMNKSVKCDRSQLFRSYFLWVESNGTVGFVSSRFIFVIFSSVHHHIEFQTKHWRSKLSQDVQLWFIGFDKSLPFTIQEFHTFTYTHTHWYPHKTAQNWQINLIWYDKTPDEYWQHILLVRFNQSKIFYFRWGPACPGHGLVWLQWVYSAHYKSWRWECVKGLLPLWMQLLILN